MPYYLHLLDPVTGTEHFYVKDETAQEIIKKMRERLSGYAVARLAREEAGKPSKTIIR